MKKFIAMAAVLLLSAGLTACGTSGEQSKEKEANGASAQTSVQKPEKNTKKDLVHFFSKLAKTINEKDKDLNKYEGSEEKPTEDMKANAAVSAAAVAEALQTFQVPSELNDQKADLEKAVTNITESYKVKASELKKASPSLDAANASFTKGEDLLGKVYEKAKMFKPSLNTEVNG